MLKKVLIFALALALMGLTAFAEAPAEDAPAATLAPEAVPEEGADGAEEAPKPAAGYVLVSTATQSGWLPLPEEGEVTFPLKQTLADGTEAVNLIHLTPEGVYMEDSTCANHDCIDQGIVTLENRKERILGNMIICLPNQVCLQLYTPEEILALYEGEGQP